MRFLNGTSRLYLHQTGCPLKFLSLRKDWLPGLTAAFWRMFSRRMITLRITVSSDVAYVTVNGRVYTPSSFQLRRGSAVVTVTDVVGRDESAQYTVVAYNADGVASEALVKAF